MCTPYILENVNPVTNPVLATKRHRITSDWNEVRNVGTSPHQGLDITGEGSSVDTIIAIERGLVTKILYNDKVRGNAVWVKHPSGYTSLYEHMKSGSIQVKLNQSIVKGQPIGTMGTTGASTGNHLHLSILDKSNKQQNPKPFLWGQRKLADVRDGEVDMYNGGIWTLPEALNDFVSTPITKENLIQTSGNGNVNTIQYETKTAKVNVETIHSVDYAGDTGKSKHTSLVSYPSLVEAPFIKVQVGDYTFGSYNAAVNGSTVKVQYPNFITGMQVTKVNGSVNQYTINMVYQIAAGNDPNMVDRIFSTVGYGTIKISYGDWQSPAFIYKEEEALITNIKSNVDFKSAKINYTIKCTSNALHLCGTTFSFEAFTGKPSDKIKAMITSPSDYYGLIESFPGMANMSAVQINNLIASNDKEVYVPADYTDPLSYINKLVSYMVAESNADDAILLDSSYYLTVVDDIYGEMNGPYFTVKHVMANSKTLSSFDTYEVDIGYPSDNMVTNFTVTSDNSWSLLYNYNESINTQDYVYSIGDDGSLVTDYAPSYAISYDTYKTKASQRTWWTQMTQFPVTAELTIKGLLRPAMLMTYIRVNSYFYGQKHISSGLYFVTRQVDTVDGRGYRTTLSLTRFAGDDDYVKTEEQTVTYKVPIVTQKTTPAKSDDSNRGGTTINERGSSHASGSFGSNVKMVEVNPLVIENNKISNKELEEANDQSGSPLVIKNNKRK